MHQRFPAIILLSLGVSLGAQLNPRPPDIPFQSHTIDLGASETAAVADINRDGRLDIVSGENWYEAPSWTKHRFRDLNFIQQYIDDFSDLPVDLDGDGYPDIVSVSWFAKRIAWWKNPGRARGEGRWKDTEIHAGFNIEFAVLADMDNDGKANEILAQENGTPQAWYEVKNGAFAAHPVSDRSYGHGIGAGDINKDGRTDILTPRGWLEAPGDARSAHWTFHPDWETTNVTSPAAGAQAHTSPADPQVTALGFMHVADVNGDGRNDVIAGAGHDYGVFWFEHTDTGPWVRWTVDNAWSQAHASTLVDLNGDGRMDLVTGKRFMAHNGGDPGEREPLGVYWYEYRPGPGTRGVEWVRHVIEYGGRVGGGMQLPVVDIDADGDLDIVCGGKSGLFLIERLSKGRPARAAGRR
jgi:hypothetical protein